MSAPSLDEQIRSHLEALEAAPGDVQAFEALVGLYESASRWEDLVALYEGRARVVPGVPLLARAASLAQQKLRNVARAEELYRQLLRLDPGNAEALRALCELLEQQEAWPALAAALEQGAAHAPDPREAARLTLRLARVHEQKLGRRDRAALLYARAHRLDPDQAEARARALACFLALRRHGQAKKLLDSAREHGAEPRTLAAEYAKLGATLVDEPLEHGLAMDALIEAQSLDRNAPGTTEARERLKSMPRLWREEAARIEAAAAEVHDRRSAAALQLRLAQLHAAYDPEGLPKVFERVERAWTLSPGNEAALGLLERVCVERGDHRGHADALARLFSQTRDRAAQVALLLELARVDLVRFGDAEQALSALHRALSLDPASEVAALHAFELEVDAGRFAPALDTLERHLAAAPEKPAHAALRTHAAALARDRLGDPVRARRHLEAALRADPGYGPAGRVLAPLLADAGEWQRLCEVLDVTARWERDPAERVRLLERLAEVQQDRLTRPREALGTLSRALATDPGRAATRKAMEGAAARADAFLELTRAYRAAARAPETDLKARKVLLRRVAEILDHDLGQPEEAVRAWRALTDLDPEDKGALAALEAAMASAGQQEELARTLEEKRGRATGEERLGLSAKLARVWAEGGEVARAAALWREVLAGRPDDEEALWGLHAALEAQGGKRAAEERVWVLARLSLHKKGHPERAQVELARAEILADPLGRLGEAAGISVSLLTAGGLLASQQAEAVALLERLLGRGVDPLRVAQVLAPAYAAAGETAKQVAMLELVARRLPPSADPRERARHLLDASTLRAERLADPRGALSDAAAALRACPDHVEARRRCEELARGVGAFRELFALLTDVAGKLGARPEEEARLRARAAAVAEEDLGAFDEAAAQLARAVTLAPGDPGLLAAQTRVALAAERWEEADELLAVRSQRAEGAERAALLAQRAEVLHERRRDPRGAAAVCREALQLLPAPTPPGVRSEPGPNAQARARLLARLAGALGDAGDTAERAEVLAQLAAEVGDPAEAARAAVESAKLHAGMGQARRAAQDLSAALKSNPEDPAALSALEGHLEGEDPEAALAASRAMAELPDPRRRLRALAVQARLAEDPGARAAAARAAARVAEAELRQASLAFSHLAAAARELPGDAGLRAELRRLAGEAQEWEACARVHEELFGRALPEHRLPIARERAELCEHRLDRDRAAQAWAQVLQIAPGDREALLALRRIHRARERWGELCDVCAEIARRAAEPTAREDALREEAAVAEAKLSDPARAALAWSGVLEIAPHDAEAAASLERLYAQLDRPEALAGVLEKRLARGFDAAAAARLAELRRRRLNDPAGALSLHAELLRRDPSRAPSRDALSEMASLPGATGREALAVLDGALRTTGDHARRVSVREARLGAVTDAGERARLHAEVRAVLESDLHEPSLAYVAACRAFAEGGPARASAAEDLPRLARACGAEADLPAVYSQAAVAAHPGEALDLRREAARLSSGPAAVAAWKEVLAAAPADVEALEQLEALFAQSRSARDLLDVARQRAALAGGEEKIAHLLEAAAQAEALGDPAAAADAYREVRAEDPARPEALSGLLRLLTQGAPGEELLEVLAALAAQAEPEERSALLLRRAGLLEADRDPRRAVEAYAEVLAENPRQAGAVAGLRRLLERPDAREPAGRLLEDVLRASGDARGLASLLEVRLSTADAAERQPLLAEIAALEERLGDRPAAFRAKLRELEDALMGGADAPAARADLERLAAATGAFEELAKAFQAALERPLPTATGLELRRRLAVIHAERLGRLDEAARWYEEVAAALPSAEVLGALARVYRRLGVPRELAATLARLAEVAPAPAARKELLLEVAKIMAEQLADRDGAVASYRKILAVDPEDPQALRLLGKLLGAAERWDELAEVLYREVAMADRQPNLVAEAAELRYRLGRIRHQRLSDPDGALALYREVLEKVPKHPAALAALEDLARGSGPAALEAAAILEPLYAGHGEHAKLVETLESRAANETDPSRRAALLRRVAEVHAGPLRNPELAFLAAGRALAADPDSTDSLDLAVRLGEVAALPEELSTLLSENADRARESTARAEYQRRIARLAQDPAAAALAWQRLLDIHPEDREGLVGLIDALKGGPDPDAHAQALRRALALEEEPGARAHLLRELSAVLDERLADPAGAIQSARSLLELVPADREALSRLDRLCQKAERWVDLSEVLSREIQLADEGDDPAPRIALRQRLAELKEARLLDREGALVLYEQVLSARPDHPEAIARLEAILQKDPANGRAARVLEAAYAAGGDPVRQAGVLELRAAERPDPAERKALYLELAELREKRLKDPEMAFLALCKAFREDPADAALRARLDALAVQSGHEEELAAILEDEIERLPPPEIAQVALRLGDLYEEKLGEPGKAAGFLRRAMALDSEAAPLALPALERLYQKLEAWPELADVLASRAANAPPPERVQLLFRLGQLSQERLAAPDRAAEAFEGAVATDPRHAPALRALEALYEGAGRKEDLFRNLSAQRAASVDSGVRERVLAKMGALAAELGRLDESVVLYKELLSIRPRHEGALAALEDLYGRLERWQELAQHLRLRISATVDRREIARLNDKLGQVLGTRLGDATQAIQSYKAVLDSDPRNKRALEALRDIYAVQGDQEGLTAAYRRLVPLQEDAAGVKRVRLELAEALLRGEQKREAVEQAKLAFDIEPHAAEELVRIEEIFRQGGAAAEGVRAAEARAALLAAQGGPAEAVPAWLAVAELWRAQKRPDAAAAALEKVLELEPANRAAYEQLRDVHTQAGNWRAFCRACDLFAPQLTDPAERLAVLKEVAGVHEKKLGQKEMSFLSWCRALSLAPVDPEVLAACERLAGETQAHDELAAVFEQVAEEARGSVRAKLLIRLGKLRDERLDDPAEAESAYRRALEADPASPDALEALAVLFERRGRVRDLVITLEQRLEAAATLDDKKTTLLELARRYDADLKDVDEAIGTLRRLLELDGADPDALEGLSTLYRREQRWADLAGVLARARDLAPSEDARIGWQLQIASLLENELSDDEAAVDAYRTVLGLDDGRVEALAGLERLYTKLDRFAELNRVYERQIALAQDVREKIRVLGRSAAIHEEKLHDPRAAIEKNEAILSLDGGNLPAVKDLERLYRAELLWDRLIPLMQHHITLVQDRREQVALEVAIGEVFWKEMARVDRAEAIFNHALQLDPDSREAVSALGRLYERSGNWNLALDMLRREARIAGGAKDAVEIHVRMGAIFEDMLLDPQSAKEAYGHALAADPGHLPAIRALKAIAERERNRDRFLELLVDEARYSTDPAEKTERYTEAGRIVQEEKDDRDGAARLYEEALKRTPGHLPAARPLSDIYVAQQRWADAERVLDGVVEVLSAGGDPKELCRQSYRLGYVAEKLGNREKALPAYRRAYDLDATYLPALEGLGNLLVREGQWEEALRIFTAILIHHRDGLTDLEVVETHWQIGEIADKMGQADRAQNAFRKALEIDANHEPSRRSLVRILEASGDYEGAVEQRQRLLPLLEGQAKFEDFVAIGEACRDRLQDPYQAIDAFLGASRIDPTSLAVTEALLGLYRETRQGQKAADVLGQIVSRPEVQADPARAARLHLSLAQILREEVKDENAALMELERALDKNPRLVQAFALVEELLTKGQRWPELEQAYVRMIQRLPKTPDAAQARLALWKTLGDLHRNVLHNDEGARTAYQVVSRADPEDAVAVETYADLAAHKAGEEEEAIQAYRQLLKLGAKSAKAAQALVKLHATRREYDKAYSAAQVLVNLLGVQTGEEVQVVGRLRKFARDQANRPLDDELWALARHERLSGPLGDIMTVLALHARPMFQQKERDLGVNPKKDELDVDQSTLFFANMFKYVQRTLGLKGMRLFKKQAVPAGLQFVPTSPPGFLAADDLFEARPKKEVWFAIGKAMIFARPQLTMARLMPHDQLDLVFQAACSVGTSRFVITADPHLVEKLKREVERTLPEGIRKNTLKLLARAYCDVQQPGDVRSYLDAAELTSNRVGALLACDLEVVRKAVVTEKAQVSKLREETRLRDLAVFCASEEYATLRERMGLSCVVPG